MDILIEPVKTMLDRGCQAASTLLSPVVPDTKIEILEETYNNTMTLYLRYNGTNVFKRVWTAENMEDLNDVRTVLYGSLMTELIATFCVVAKRSMEQLVDVDGNPL